MRIAGFIRLAEVIEKIEAKHGVSVGEVEAIFRFRPYVTRVQSGRFRGEDVYRALGRTLAGRYLVVFLILKRDGDALVLSARDMDRKERRCYARHS